jgi:hypothetical protein
MFHSGRFIFAVALTLLLAAPRSVAQEDGAATSPSTQPTSRPASGPFSRLRVRVPAEKLRPIRAVRVRNPSETRRGRIKVKIKTTPSKASVTHGGRKVGVTPLTIVTERNSTPMDVVIRRAGYMILRTRIMRRVSRTYSFVLTPAKVN